MVINVAFVGQLVESMNSAVLQLEQAIDKKKIDEANKLRTFIFDLYMQINSTLEGKNV